MTHPTPDQSQAERLRALDALFGDNAIPMSDRNSRLYDIIYSELRASSGIAGAVGVPPKGYAVAPKEIWLQLHGDCDESDLDDPVDYEGSDDVTWCWHPIHNTDIRYVRADLASSPTHPEPANADAVDAKFLRRVLGALNRAYERCDLSDYQIESVIGQLTAAIASQEKQHG
jgi:hypothetical protein